MAIRTRSYLKLKFQNGDKPPEDDFWDWQDSFWHKSELPGGITIAAPAGGTTYALPAGTYLREIVVYGATPGTITVNKQFNGADLFTDEPYTSQGNPALVANFFFKDAETLAFLGYTGTVTIKLYYQ